MSKMFKLVAGVAAAITGVLMASGGVRDTIGVFKKKPEDGDTPVIPEAEDAEAEDMVEEGLTEETDGE